MYWRTARVEAGVKHPGIAELIEPRAVGDKRRLMHMARDHHRRLIALDPLHEFFITEKAFAAPTGRRIRRWCVMNPDPSRQPPCGSFAKLVFNSLLDERPVPPRADRE